MDSIEQRLTSLIAEVNPSIQLKADDFGKSIADAGIDSLVFSSVLLRIEETMGIKISDAESEKIGSLKDLCQLVDAKKAA